ncbi:MFS transporter [Arcobacter sp. FWKO B]|uniref:MFS transporter n=1 Tax=Arcobacter sp. FWKO B TaxID=2593672 RepID=UPI0018A34C25|nr:MFS transporter [Arcobacter sp. FWKO B]QOG12892.1 MFS transporter [Arcobacter sp. FWKO B]
MFKQVMPLSSIISLRFFGLFLVLPLISLYAITLENATPFLVGVVVGGYALTQMFFQVPFGSMSDKFGRKPTIIFGIVLFGIGSLICALSDDIYMLILGRLLQGAGAIGAVVTAMISDLVKEEVRGKAMAMMGGSIAVSFALAMFFGPFIGGLYGMSVLFWITFIIAIVSILILVLAVPNPPKIKHTYEQKVNYKEILTNGNLVKMNITNFLQKGLMTFAFVLIPVVMTKVFAFETSELYKVYLPALILGVIAMGPSAVLAEKKGKYKEMLIVGIAFFALSFAFMGFSSSDILFIVGITIFFVGFNIHEPIMQSLTTKFAKINQKGSVLGVFNSFGYLGTFFGGVLGGYILAVESLHYVGTSIIIVCIAWGVLIYMMPNPSAYKNIYLDIDKATKEFLDSLDLIDGISEWYINESDKKVIIKYNSEVVNQETILDKCNK